ncbi:DUF3300 domain-containing protein [Hyphomicrobium methylovorum]|uniref:DUF3300 domain-containing protein n=1 Tax=Hyphomicrobium methylovorum TaxID=84 RepID=UPI0015E7A49A|nr:DUF3300 domain-containing protein [Hyphomicrobium methylovorum]MBA2125881.1 DUF3300 domain-containing protein [Hyphomicrobium methylovorum]
MKVFVRSLFVLLIFVMIGAAPSRADDQKFTKQQLDQMLAPIALYPDDLLSNVLMAATYPLDVVEAERWRSVPENASLQGEALVDALKSKTWDPSIKAIVQFPDVLKMMSDQLDWTQNLGNAFLAQQDQVMDQVQFLRSKADSSGHLRTNSQQTVTRQDGAYIIRPANPDTVYVPIYEPSVVYGSWWYPDYPPYYWGYPGAVFTDGFFWGATGIAIASGIWGWNHWDWHNRRIDIDTNRWNRIDVNRRNISNNVWKHDPKHRGDFKRGDKNFNRAQIEKRLHDGGRPGAKAKVDQGAQLRQSGRNFSPAKKGNVRPAHRRGGGAARNFERRGGGHVARPARHFKSAAPHRGGVRRGGGRRR